MCRDVMAENLRGLRLALSLLLAGTCAGMHWSLRLDEFTSPRDTTGSNPGTQRTKSRSIHQWIATEAPMLHRTVARDPLAAAVSLDGLVDRRACAQPSVEQNVESTSPERSEEYGTDSSTKWTECTSLSFVSPSVCRSLQLVQRTRVLLFRQPVAFMSWLMSTDPHRLTLDGLSLDASISLGYLHREARSPSFDCV